MKSKLLLMGAAMATLTACGGGGSSTPTTTTVTTTTKPPVAASAAEAPVSSYMGGPVTGGGKIEGEVTYAGTEADATVTITKDPTVCAMKDATTRPAGTLLAKDGKLANVIVWLDGVKAGKPAKTDTVELDNESCTFKPHVLVGWVGGKVAAKNSDPVLHNTNLSFNESGKPIANIALPTQGMTSEKDLRRAGLVKIKCDAHEWMSAWMLVSESPYATVTGEDGKFSFDQVPAGTYTVKFWHERLGEKMGSVTVAADGTATANQAF